MHHGLHRDIVAIDIDVAKLAERSQIVESTHMVVMAMGEQQTIDTPKRQWHELHSDVRATIDKDASMVGFQQRSGAIPLVVRVRALTHLTVASIHRNTRGGSCAQESQPPHAHITFTSGCSSSPNRSLTDA